MQSTPWGCVSKKGGELLDDYRWPLVYAAFLSAISRICD
jgi:hypothetical protein